VSLAHQPLHGTLGSLRGDLDRHEQAALPLADRPPGRQPHAAADGLEHTAQLLHRGGPERFRSGGKGDQGAHAPIVAPAGTQSRTGPLRSGAKK